jgi:hypothetical protein
MAELESGRGLVSGEPAAAEVGAGFVLGEVVAPAVFNVETVVTASELNGASAEVGANSVAAVAVDDAAASFGTFVLLEHAASSTKSEAIAMGNDFDLAIR